MNALLARLFPGRQPASEPAPVETRDFDANVNARWY